MNWTLNSIAGRYGRLDKDGMFGTSIGTLVPHSPCGRILHPSVSKIAFLA